MQNSEQICQMMINKDLEQIEKYIDWARASLIGTGPNSPKYITGLLIVGQRNSNQVIRSKQVRLAGSDIRVDTYGDSPDGARKIYGEVERRLKAVAPEYLRKARQSRKKPKK